MPSFRVRRRDAQQSAGQQRDEAYRLLRTNVEVALADLDRPTVLVTSAHTGEGKSRTTTELARSFALAGRRVIAVDFDLRNPTMHSAYGESAEPGVSDLLRERCALPDAIRYLTFPSPAGPAGLYVLTAGSSVANPSELISTQRAARLLESLSEQADIVLIDSPPVLPVADTLVLARMVGGVLLVVNSGSTTYAAATRAKDTLVRNHARLLGMVLNRFESGGGDYQIGYGGDYPVSDDRAREATTHVADDDPARGNGFTS